ncbi:hypothetical protein ACFWY6_06515 [Streptomyces sp. NPDC059037]|uniref:hypothetical protein n=1 Tax=Streptomyces sp. NPDC059037 TaxID=3346710 RepID=UPI0036A46B2E
MVERSLPNLLKSRRWERLHVFFAVCAVLAGAVVATYFTSSGILVGKEAGATLSDRGFEEPISIRFTLALGVTYLGFAFHRRMPLIRSIKQVMDPSRDDQIYNTVSYVSKFHFFLLINITYSLLAFASTISRSVTGWTAGWATLTGAALLLGYVASRAAYGIESYLIDREASERGNESDEMVRGLFYLSGLLCTALKSGEYTLTKIRRMVRSEVRKIASGIEFNSIPRKYTRWSERKLRREVMQPHRLVADLLREHARALGKVHSEEDFERICESVIFGFMAAYEGDMNRLVENAPESTRSSRLSRAIRYCGPAAVMVVFAIAIPLLPGAGDAAASVRVFLFATAALTLIPGSTSARSTVESALSKALPAQPKS